MKNCKTVIDLNKTYQTFNGFGASACWLSQEIGGWKNAKDILSLLYGKENGIGLNIYRYNLGAESKNDSTIFGITRRTDGFMKKDKSYDFTADKNAQHALKIAKELAGNDLRVTLFCNSPPTALTINGKAYCNVLKKGDRNYTTNISKESYAEFADFCYNSAEYFLNKGYRITDLSPVNEPQWGWNAWYNDDESISAKQEGCYYTEEETAALLKEMVKRFKGSEVDKRGCKVSMFESGRAGGKTSQNAKYLDCILSKENADLRDYFESISIHSYWASEKEKKEAAEYFAEKYPDFTIACTEYCQMANDENSGVFELSKKENGHTNGLSIEYGTALADTIIFELKTFNATEWDWWLACSFGLYPDGLVYLNPDDRTEITASKRLWCMGNFSKFIDEGAKRIECTCDAEQLKCCAFKNPDESIVVIYSNSSGQNFKTGLSEFNSNDVEIYTTNSVYDLKNTYSGKITDKINIQSQSVVTVIIK